MDLDDHQFGKEVKSKTLTMRNINWIIFLDGSLGKVSLRPWLVFNSTGVFWHMPRSARIKCNGWAETDRWSGSTRLYWPFPSLSIARGQCANSQALIYQSPKPIQFFTSFVFMLS